MGRFLFFKEVDCLRNLNFAAIFLRWCSIKFFFVLLTGQIHLLWVVVPSDVSIELTINLRSIMWWFFFLFVIWFFWFKFISCIIAIKLTSIIFLIGAFEDPDIIHVDDSVDPVRDLEVISEELRLKVHFIIWNYADVYHTRTKTPNFWDLYWLLHFYCNGQCVSWSYDMLWLIFLSYFLWSLRHIG